MSRLTPKAPDDAPSGASTMPTPDPSLPAALARDLDALAARLQRTIPDARLTLQPLPGCPNLRLALINADYPTGPLPEAVMRAVIAAPAYWAFCWGSGLALARWLLAHPDQVRGRRVVDLGPGSGVVAIAAALAGADAVIACDNDADALAATAFNARLNGVKIDLAPRLEAVPAGQDLLLMADVLYDRSNLPLLREAAALANTALVADSRIQSLPDPAYRLIGTDDALTLPNLGEFDEFRTVRFFLSERTSGRTSGRTFGRTSGRTS